MEAFLILLLFAALAFYFLPTIIGRNKSFAMQLFILNLLLGWTFLGWVIALVWSFKIETPIQTGTMYQPQQQAPNVGDIYTALEKLSKLHKDGIITDAEFEKQKQILLNK